MTTAPVPPADLAPAVEVRVSLRLQPNADGIGCGWRASVAVGDAEPLQFASLEELLAQLGRLARGGPPARGIR